MFRYPTSRALLLIPSILGSAFVPTTVYAQNCSGVTCSQKNPNDSNDDYCALQACLNAGGTIQLATSGTYLVSKQLRLKESNTTLTSSGIPRKAIIQAMPNMQSRLLLAERDNSCCETVKDFTISRITFIGDRQNSNSGTLPCDLPGGPTCADFAGRCGHYGQNVAVTGERFMIDEVESVDATCGTSFYVSGADFVVRNSSFTSNGREQFTPNIPPSFADGLTVGSCNRGPAGPGLAGTGCYIHGNFFNDNTDVGLVVGGGSGGRIESNWIMNSAVHAFAGMHVGWFPLDSGNRFGGVAGNHSAITYQNNFIISGLDKMALGLMVGAEPWYNGDNAVFVPHAGTIINNTIQGAVVNLAIDGIGAGNITGNTYSNHRGTWGFDCSTSKDYTAHFFGSATIQSGWEPFWFFRKLPFNSDQCGSWNTEVPWIDGAGSLYRDTELQVNVPLYSQNLAYNLILESNGNLVLKHGSTHVWATGTNTGAHAVMQMDGNFVLYNSSYAVLFKTDTNDNYGAYLVVQNDGNLVVHGLDGSVLWSLF